MRTTTKNKLDQKTNSTKDYANVKTIITDNLDDLESYIVISQSHSSGICIQCKSSLTELDKTMSLDNKSFIKYKFCSHCNLVYELVFPFSDTLNEAKDYLENNNRGQQVYLNKSSNGLFAIN